MAEIRAERLPNSQPQKPPANWTFYKPSVAENQRHCFGIDIYNENTNHGVWSAGSFINRHVPPIAAVCHR
jgi:hypothetical protein